MHLDIFLPKIVLQLGVATGNGILNVSDILLYKLEGVTMV